MRWGLTGYNPRKGMVVGHSRIRPHQLIGTNPAAIYITTIYPTEKKITDAGYN